MKISKHTFTVVTSIVLFILAISSTSFGITLEAIYTGASGGNWNTASNWDIAVVPINQGAVNFNVTIPAGKQVIFNVPGADPNISNFTLGDSGTNDAQLTINAGYSLRIAGTANIYDFIDGEGGNFTATATTDSLKGNQNRIWAHNGSHITIKDTKFDANGLNGSYTILSADGAGSNVNLSWTTSLNDGFLAGYYGYVHTIQATNGGAINLSAVASITGPAYDESLSIILDNTGGSINLNSLATITHTAGYGFTRFNVTGNSLSLPVLSSVDFVAITSNNATVTLPVLNDVSNTTFAASGGGKIYANASSFTYSASGLNNGNYILMSCDDSGSVLDLSGMTSLNDGFLAGYYGYVHTIQATNGGAINLSAVASITGPAYDESLSIILDNTGGSINLNSLATITHTAGYGFTRFNVTGNSLSLPVLSSVDFVAITSNNATVTLPVLNDVSNTTFAASGGGKIYANASSFTYSASGLNNGNYILMSCVGSGSVLDLSGMTSLNDGFLAGYYGYVHTIQATNGGAINLSAVASITGPSYDESLSIILDNTGGSINLNSLATITHAGQSGFTRFDVNDNKLDMPVLSSVVFTTIQVRNNGEMFVGDLVAGVSSNISLTNGGTFKTRGGLTSTAAFPVTMDAISNELDIAGDINFSNTMTVDANTSYVSVGGSLLNRHTIENNVKLRKAIVHFSGIGVQQLEVGGLDVDLLINILTNDNFGIGQLVVGQCDQPALVQLVEDVNNGNRASNNPEALYLFGLADGSNGLRIISGSVLMIGELNVYAKINGTLIRLRDLFSPGQNVVAFDEGYIMLGTPSITHPFNLITNGGFESGTNPPTAITLSRTLANGSPDINRWSIAGDGIDWCHDALFNDNTTGGHLSVDLCGNTAGAGIIRQTITTLPGHRYFVWFDMGFNPLGNIHGQAGIKTLELSAGADNGIFTIDSNIPPTQWPADPNKGWTIPWQNKLWSFVAMDTNATLAFACADNPPTPYGAAIDNIVVIEGGELAALLTGDIDGNNVVNLTDVKLFVEYWLDQGCGGLEGCWCGGADMDKDGDVDFMDYALLADNWLKRANLVYTLSVSSTSGGSVSTPGIGNFVYKTIQSIPITAVAAANYHFIGWTGSAVDAGKVAVPLSASTTVTIDSDYTLAANFALDNHSLNISSGLHGTVTTPGIGAFNYPYGTVLPISAQADDFYHFTGWTGTAVDDGMVANPASASTTITISDDCTLVANFALNPLIDDVNVTLDTNPGWSTSGQWAFGVPTGQGGSQHPYPDPTSGHTGTNVYGVNLNGDYATSVGGPYYLMTGPFNLTGQYNTLLEFASWLNTDNSEYVVHSLQISNNGSDWNILWQQTGTNELTANSWAISSFDISAYADNHSVIYVRWGYAIITSRAYPYSGWNIDDIKIKGRAK